MPRRGGPVSFVQAEERAPSSTDACTRELDIQPARIIHGWGPIGQRVPGIVPRNRGRVTTMLGALSIDGIEAMMTVQGGTTADVFRSGSSVGARAVR